MLDAVADAFQPGTHVFQRLQSSALLSEKAALGFEAAFALEQRLPQRGELLLEIASTRRRCRAAHFELRNCAAELATVELQRRAL